MKPPIRLTPVPDPRLCHCRAQVAPFLIKLFEIVSSPASDNLVCWSEHGESFRIVDRTKFAQVKCRSSLVKRPRKGSAFSAHMGATLLRASP